MTSPAACSMIRRCRMILVGSLAACVGGMSLPVVAQVTWLGTASTSWTNATNWDGGVAPTTTGTAVFGATVAANQPTMASGTLASLQFLRPEGGWTVTASGSLTLSGATAVDDSLNTSGTTTLAGIVRSINPSTWTIGSGGTVRVTNALSFANTSDSLTVSGGMLSVSHLAYTSASTFIKYGTGTLLVSGSSGNVGEFWFGTATAGTPTDVGTVIIGNRYAMGTGSLIRVYRNAATLQATTDLTGTNAIPKGVRVFGTSESRTVNFSGTGSMEFNYLETSRVSLGTTVMNNLIAGKTLTFGSVNGNVIYAAYPITFSGSGSTIITGSVADGTVGATSYTKAGSGMLTLRGTGFFTGGMAVQAGTLKLENAAALGTTAPLQVTGGLLDLGGLTVTKSGTITLSGGTTANGTLVNDTVNYAVTQGTVSANLAGAVGLTKTTSGAAVLSGSNSYGGATTISAGRLQFASRTSLYGGTSALWTAANLNTSGTLALNVGGPSEFDQNDVTALLVNLGGTGGSVNNNGLRAGSRIGFDTSNAAGGTFTIADNIANSVGTGGGAIGLVKLGSGTLVLTGSNSFSGGTTVLGGLLRLGSANASGSITVIGGLLDMGNASGTTATVTLGGVATQTGFGGGGTLTLGGTVTYAASPAGAVIEPNLVLSGTRTFDVGGSGAGADALTVSSVISSTGGLTKTGTGLLVLSGTASTYTGRTTVPAGTLAFASIANTGTGNASALGAPSAGNGTIDLATGATLRYIGTDATGHSTDRTVNITSTTGTATLEAAGSGPVALGAITAAAGGAITLQLGGSSTAGNAIAGAIANPSGGTTSLLKSGTGSWTLSGSNSFSGQTSITQGTLVAASNTALGVSPPATLVGGTDAGLGGTAALLLGGTTSLNQTLQVLAAGGGATQGVILGGANTSGTTSFGSAIVRVARDVTLQAATNGAVRFSSNWTGASGSGSLTDRSFTFGSAGNTGTVIVSSSIATTGGMTVAAGVLRLADQIVRPGAGQQFLVGSAGELAGTGTVAAVLAGSGGVGPGNSPGILLADGVDPTGGLDFDFEFTDLAPLYPSPTASVNDILRLTGTAPFTQNLTALNSIDIYFPAAVLTTATSPAQTYRGGFFTDSTAAQYAGFQSAISGASFTYYVSDPSGTISYKGNPYSLLPGTILVTPTTTTVASAGFSGGTVTNGQIMTFVVVPEPGALALAAIGIAAAASLVRRQNS